MALLSSLVSPAWCDGNIAGSSAQTRKICYCDCDQDRDASMCTRMCELPKYQNRWWATSCHKTRSEEGNHTPPPSHNRSKQNEHPEHASLK